MIYIFTMQRYSKQANVLEWERRSSTVKAPLLMLDYLQWLLTNKLAPLCCRDIHFKKPGLNTDFCGS